MPYNHCTLKRFLIVGDHKHLCSDLNSLIKETYCNSIIIESAAGPDIIEKLKTTVYDLIIVDVPMPDCESLWFINYIHIEYPAIPILASSMTSGDIYALRVLKAGAKGFVSKDSSKEELKQAIILALNGKIYHTHSIAEMIRKEILKKTDFLRNFIPPREFQWSA